MLQGYQTIRVSARPRALLISPEAPYPLDSGGALRTASLLHYLGERYDLDVVIFKHAGQDVTTALPPGLVKRVQTIELHPHRRNIASRALRNGVRLIGNRPPLVDRFGGYEPELLRMLHGRMYDVAVLEHFWTASYLPIMRQFTKRLVLDLHNIESAWHTGCARAASFPRSAMHDRFARTARALEDAWLPQCDLILATSSDDAERVRTPAPHVTTCVYPNAIPWRPVPERESELAIAFCGNLEYEPNQTAVQFFLEQIWPPLAQRFPALTFRLVGKNPQPIPAHVPSRDRIQVTGAVEDTFSFLAASQVCVAPLLSGSGTRLKIIEYWAAQRAVVSTRAGAEGLGAEHGRNIRLADDAATFVSSVSDLLNDPQSRRELAESGRRKYEQCFTWPAAWETISLQL